MKALVIDTDVVSYIFKNDSRAALYKPHLTGCLLVISFMTRAELELWMLRRNWGAERRGRFEAHLKGYVIHGFDQALCRTWAEVSDSAIRGGRRIEAADAWIAATAVYHGLPLVTHNAEHFQGVERLTIVSEAPK